MWSLGLVFLLSFVQLISCQDYDALRKDECFRQIYICGDYRLSVTASNGFLETDPRVFGKICRDHKKYMACVDDAVSNHCNESMSDMARMTLNNRLSLKLLCTDPEWRKRYYSSASCINKYKERVQQDCTYEEENMNVDNSRLLWDLPEPCDSLQRVFNCAVQKMNKLCGAIAAEVFKRMQILDEHNLDVTCEFRRRNPMQCQYEPKKKHFVAVPKDPHASSCNLDKQPETVAAFDKVKEVIVNIVKNVNHLFRLKVIDSDNVKLQKLNSVEDEESSNCEEDGSKLCKRFGLKKDFNIHSDIGKIKRGKIKRLKKFAEFEEIKFRKISKIQKDLHLRIRNYLFKFLNVLRHGEIIIGSLKEKLFEIYWTNLEFPVQSIICEMINTASKNVFNCSIKWDLHEIESDARRFSNLDDKNSKSVHKGHLSDIHRDGYLVKKELLNKKSSLDKDYDDSDWEVHGKALEDPSSKFVSDDDSDPYELLTESFLELMYILFLSFYSEIREIEAAIGKNPQIISANMKSNTEGNHYPTDKLFEDCGIKTSVFTDPDMGLQDNIPVTEASKKEKLLIKPQLETTLGVTETTIEAPFHDDLIERYLYELEHFTNGNEKIIARDEEFESSHEGGLDGRDVELSIEERGEILARDIKKRMKNRGKNLVREIKKRVKNRRKNLAKVIEEKVKGQTENEKLRHKEL